MVLQESVVTKKQELEIKLSKKEKIIDRMTEEVSLLKQI